MISFQYGFVKFVVWGWKTAMFFIIYIKELNVSQGQQKKNKNSPLRCQSLNRDKRFSQEKGTNVLKSPSSLSSGRSTKVSKELSS